MQGVDYNYFFQRPLRPLGFDNRPYAHDVISVGRPHVEVKRMLFIGQSCAPRVQICTF